MGKYSDYIGITKATNPQIVKSLKGKVWRANCRIGKSEWKGPFRATDREAAIDYDKRLITLGREPVNILKKKT